MQQSSLGLAGYYVAIALPLPLTLGLVFLNPIYFMLVFAADLRVRPRVYAMVLGAISGPLFFLASPQMGLLITGLVAGTVGFLLGRAHDRAAARRKRSWSGRHA